MHASFSASRAAVFAGAFAALLIGAQSPARAEEVKPAAPGVITASGEGVALAAPDMAVISLTVLREADTARQALDANNSAMSQVLEAMKAEGVAERDLQTGAFSMQPRWVHPQTADAQPDGPRIVGYTVHNSLTVRIRDLEKLGGILDKSVSLGVNQGGNILFTNDDKESLHDAARMDAIAKAKAKAMRMTEALGVSLGRITQISESERGGAPMLQAEMAMASRAADKVPVAAGENEYRITVHVTWEIAQ